MTATRRFQAIRGLGLALALTATAGGRVGSAQPVSADRNRATGSIAAGPGADASILVLDNQEPGRPIYQQFVTGLRTAVDRRLPQRNTFYVEALDLGRLNDPELTELSVRWLAEKYARKEIDLIVSTGEPTIAMARDLRRLLGRPRIPIVGMHINPGRPTNPDSLPPLEDGVNVLIGELDALEAAHIRQLIPNLSQLLIVAGFPQEVPFLYRQMRSVLGESVQIDTMVQPTLAELRERMALLNASSAIFYQSVTVDSDGQPWTPRDYLQQLSTFATRPVFGYLSSFAGYGVLGGPMVDGTDLGDQVGTVVATVLLGASTDTLPSLVVNPGLYIYDWALVKRFGIDPKRLPAGAVFLNKPVPVWEQYPRTSLIVGGMLSLQLMSIVLLTTSRRQLRRAHAARGVMSQRMLRAQDEERQRIARDLHDDLCQEMTVLALEADRPDSAGSRDGALAPRLRSLIDRTRSIALGLHTMQVSAMQLPDALTAHAENLMERTGITMHVHAESWPQVLPRDVTLALFRAVQEALQNVMRHAEATECTVTLQGSTSGVSVEVRDDGIGFEPDTSPSHGLGLVTMQERLESVGGRCVVRSTAFAGTTLTFAVPLHPPAGVMQ